MRDISKTAYRWLFSNLHYILTPLIIIVASVYFQASVAFTVVLIVWAIMFLYSVCHLKENSCLFCFLASLFVFLLGREVCYTFFGLERYYLYLVPYDDFAFTLIAVSLIFISLGMKLEKVPRVLTKGPQKPWTGEKYQLVSKIVFYICWIVAIAETAIRVIIIRRIGYVESYTADSAATISLGPLPYISGFTSVAVCLFLATKPKKISALIALICYEVYGFTTLFTGHRFTFISITLFVIIYFFIRHNTDGGWVKKWHIIVGICAVPVLLISMAAIDNIRSGSGFKIGGVLDGIRSFLDQQGGSINVIKRIKFYEKEISDLFLCSFDNLRSCLSENAVMRFLFGVKTYSGNSVEHALYGNSLAHRLSLYEYGDNYLQGHGVGSSYIAELYHDFNIFGLIVGNIFYGYLIKRISNIKFTHYFADALVLMTVNGIILAPRGNFDGFVSEIFGIYSLIGIFAVWLVSNIISQRSSFYELKREN